MSNDLFTTVLFLPAQAAAETEAMIVKWHVGEGDSFTNGQVLAEVESAKSTFEFDAPCDGNVLELLIPEGATTPFDQPVIKIETADQSLNIEVQHPFCDIIISDHSAAQGAGDFDGFRHPA